jgi:hypothetical protein
MLNKLWNFLRYLARGGAKEKGYGRVYDMNIFPVVGVASRSKMDKTWKKAFNGIDTRNSLSKIYEYYGTRVDEVEGVAAIRACRILEKKGTGFKVNLNDRTDHYEAIKNKELQLKTLRDRESQAIKEGSAEEVLKIREEIFMAKERMPL